jgi:hypothetical protein
MMAAMCAVKRSPGAPEESPAGAAHRWSAGQHAVLSLAGSDFRPGGSNVVLIVGSITGGISIIVALSAYSTRETFRVHMNDLGNKNAVPAPREEYDRIRTTGVEVPV